MGSTPLLWGTGVVGDSSWADVLMAIATFEPEDMDARHAKALRFMRHNMIAKKHFQAKRWPCTKLFYIQYHAQSYHIFFKCEGDLRPNVQHSNNTIYLSHETVTIVKHFLHDVKGLIITKLSFAQEAAVVHSLLEVALALKRCGMLCLHKIFLFYKGFGRMNQSYLMSVRERIGDGVDLTKLGRCIHSKGPPVSSVVASYINANSTLNKAKRFANHTAFRCYHCLLAY